MQVNNNFLTYLELDKRKNLRTRENLLEIYYIINLWGDR